MKGIVTVVLLLLSAQASALTGEDVLTDCPTALGASDDLTVEQLLNGTHCMGYVAGLYDMAPLLTAVGGATAFCPPSGGLDPGSAVRVFLDWLAAHPARLQENARALFISAMTQTYPCH